MFPCMYTGIGRLRAATVVKGSLLWYVGHLCPLVCPQGYGPFVPLQLKRGPYCVM